MADSTSSGANMMRSYTGRRLI
ncbi:MAG: hypothetical protein QOI02_765, partial [Actinomycetota bacterium]|nr:hypothetical protein [Actinomycetota bacterium]